LPKIKIKDKHNINGIEEKVNKIKPKSPKKLPNLSPSKLPMYPSIQRKDIKDDNPNQNNDASEIEKKMEIKKKKKKLEKRNTFLGLTERDVKEKVEKSFKKKEEDQKLTAQSQGEAKRSKRKERKLNMRRKCTAFLLL
jgi:hypothetical protein